MSTYSKISLAQIDADALADYVVAKKKLVYRSGDESVTMSDKAQDVERVAGVLAENTAVHVENKDRSTVQKAIELLDENGEAHPFSDFMTLNEGSSVIAKQGRIKNQYGNELQNLRDELYELRQELAKSGFIEDRGEYVGYIDTFRANASKHMDGLLAMAEPAPESERTDKIFIEDRDVLGSLNVYDYIVIRSDSLKKFDVKQIEEIDMANKIVTLDSEIRQDIYETEGGMSLYWSFGMNDEGMFKFARPEELSMASEDNHTGLSDDTYKIIKHTFVPGTGFGYSFRVPEEKQGYVTSFEICAKAYGTPGSMICYLLDARDIENFHNPAQAAEDYAAAKENRDESFHFFAASRPLTLQSSYGRRYIRFDFKQDNDTYPLMSRDDHEPVRYIAVIECLDCDQDNYYDIIFLQHKNSEGVWGDLELNNITYRYERQADGSALKALSTDEEINASDMYYHIVTRNVVVNEIEPEPAGLYTFHVRTKDLMNRARVMLRIKKEGAFAVTTENEVPLPENKMDVFNTDTDNGIRSTEDLRVDNLVYNPIELRQNDIDITAPVKVAVGNNITTVVGWDDSKATFSTYVLARNEDPIYRIAYIVSLKARRVEYNPDSGQYETNGDTENPVTFCDDPKYNPYLKHVHLPLVEIFKDYRRRDITSSDRLLYEADLFGEEAGEADYYNDFIVQVYWSNRSMSNEYRELRKAQMGAIKDISVAFNSTI